jgi:putative ABC transport system permease protein
MPMLSRLTSFLRNTFGKRPNERELDDEVRGYVDLLAAEKMRQGISPEEARRSAQIELGGIEQVKEQVREARAGAWLDSLFQDLRYGARMLRKNPGFTAIAVLTLALGIGATTAIFSVVDAVLLRPLPYDEPDRLVTISESNSSNDLATRNPVAPGNYLDWRSQNTAFSHVVATHFPGFSLTGSGRPERALGAAISAGALGMLGLRPHLGREIAPEDDRPDANAVVMLSDSLWRRRFNANRDIVGKTIHLDAAAYTVIGVLPPGLQFPQEDVDLWVPLEHELDSKNMHWRNSHYLDVYARLKPGITLPQAREEMNRIAGSLKRTYPDTNSGAGTIVQPLQHDLVSGIRPALLTLLFAVGFVLLIACANVANLLLVRAIRREKELSIRVALGAGSSRLVRQLLTESILLSFAGAVAGLLIAGWVRQALLALRPAGLPLYNSVRTDFRVLLFTLAVSVLTGILFGLMPALRAARADVNLVLKNTSRSVTSGFGATRLRSVLVAGEIAISLILLIGAGLLIQSFFRLRNTDLGFRTDHTLTMRISIPADKYPQDGQVVAFCDRLLDKVRTLPGVERAGMVSFLPLTGHEFDNSFDIVGRPPFPPSHSEYPQVRTVDPQYFSVLGIPVLRGRALNDLDRLAMPRAIVISESMARRYWHDESPLGEHVVVYMGEDQSPWEIVGVASDVRTDIDAESQPMIYFPYAQMPYRYMVLAVRTHADSKTTAETIRMAASSIDPDRPLYQVRTLEELLAQTLVPWRFSTTLVGAFAALALLLASAGVYGVISYTVGQRTGEIGIRMALGAEPRHVLWPILFSAMKLCLAGIAVGLVGAAGLSRFLVSQLYGVHPTDVFTFAAVTLLLVVVASAASYIPARRASRVDPMIALRHE